MKKHKAYIAGVAMAVMAMLLNACSTGDGDSVTAEGDVAIAYVKRPVATLGNPTDAITFSAGGDLYLRERSSPSATETNLTASLTNGQGDVSDPEVSYDGAKLLFSMRRAADPGWRVWEYDIARKTFRQIVCAVAAPNPTPAGDDVDPAYLPDGRIVFASNRQETSQRVNGFAYLDEYERERVTALHVMNNDGSNCRQISYNQSHDRNPTVLQTGEVMYSRWDHVGMRNQFSVFFTNPDGTNLFVLYGAHSPGNSYLHPRETQDGKLLSSLMPLSGTREGGALMAIDVKNYSENCEPAPGVAAGCNGQSQPTSQTINFGQDLSQFGRFSTPYPLWDGTNRALVSWTPSCSATNTCAQVANPLTGALEAEESTPVYGIYMLDLSTRTTRPVVVAPTGFAVLDPIAIQPRPTPNIIADKSLDAALAARGMGVLNVKSVYDTDSQGRMGASVLVSGIGESIPLLSGVADIARLKNPALTLAAQRPARFLRVTRAVPTESGISREAIGETEFEMQRILGYTEIEPDGSFKIEVPADMPIALTVIDRDGRGFTPHTNWIQVRPGETRTCNGCHSPRRGNAINATPIAGAHPNTLPAMAAQSGESMAETRTRLDSLMLALKPHMAYSDVWTDQTTAGRAPDAPLSIDYAGVATAVPVNGVVDYPTHIHALWNRGRGANTCTNCHNDGDRNNVASAGLDLRNGTAGTGRFNSYEELMVGDPVLDPLTGLPQFEIDDGEIEVVREAPQVVSGGARLSHLIEVLFNQELRSAQSLGATNHGAMLNASEKRLVSEWIDLGGQYFNSPRDGSNNLRGVTGLSRAAFDATVHPVLINRCSSCHRAVGADGAAPTAPNPGFQSNRFVLTGQAEGDFNVTLTMINNTANPAATLLLSRPVSNGIAPNPVHPQIGTPAAPVLSPTDPDYRAICNWIQAGACP